MTNFYNASKYLIAVLLILCLCSLILSMYLVYSLLRNKMKKGYYITLIITAFIESWVFFVYLLGISNIQNGINQGPVTNLFMEIPVFFISIIVTIGFIVLILLYLHVLKHLENTIVPSSISYGLNSIDLGICFYEADGLPRLVNRSLEALSFRFTKKYLSDGNEFIEGVRNNKDNIIVEDRKDRLVIQNNGEFFRIKREMLQMNNKEYYRLIVADVTEEYNLLLKLEEENKKREQYQKRLKEYSKDLEQLTINEEVLDTKMNIHSSYGQILLIGKHSIESNEDRYEFVNRWNKLANLVFAEDYNDLDELLRMAKNLGVHIQLSDDLDTKDILIYTKLLNEVFTNTSKHTNAKTIYLDCIRQSGYISYACYNDEENLNEQFHEGGGLSSLRRLVERNGFTMEIDPKPYFKVIITRKENESNVI